MHPRQETKRTGKGERVGGGGSEHSTIFEGKAETAAWNLVTGFSDWNYDEDGGEVPEEEWRQERIKIKVE